MLWGEDGSTGAGVSSSSAHRLHRQAQDINCKSWLGEEDVAKGSLVQSDVEAVHGMRL